MFDDAEKKKVLLGISGSIAAYKAAEYARMLVSWGYEVKVVMTESAQQFLGAVSMQAITGNPVVTEFWGDGQSSGIGHIELADWADVVAIVPATADFIAKMAAGFADDPLLAVVLATRAPVMVAPAMNSNMYDHPKTRENIALLRERGVFFVDPEEGELACGWNGNGRLASPWEIFYNTRRVLSPLDLAGRHILIATGPTREAIDPVRFLTNRSSGKMGVALAREAFRRGAQVTLVHGPVKVKVPEAVKRIPVTSALDMHAAMMAAVFGAEAVAPDMVIMAAAVADFRPAEIVQHKVKKSEHPKSITLIPNPDILADLGERRGSERMPVLIGFAVETGEEEELVQEARRKLEAKRADLIVGNLAEEAFDRDTNRVWLVDRYGKHEDIATTYKSRVANKILDAGLRMA